MMDFPIDFLYWFIINQNKKPIATKNYKMNKSITES
jgi:hypothetical protein